MEHSVILGACRTPFGKLGGGLAPLSAMDLGGIAIRESIRRANLDPGLVEHVIMGCVIQAGLGQVPSRQAAFKAGLSKEVTSDTLNRVCASGMRSVSIADAFLRCGEHEVIVAGGMESMSNAPYLLAKARWGYRLGNDALLDSLQSDGLLCPINRVHMGVYGSDSAKEVGVTREEMDRWALRSHQLAVRAQEQGLFAEEIVPVEIPDRKKGVVVVDKDEGPRADTSYEALANLKPIFGADGAVTAGNAPGVNDGAGALVVSTPEFALEHGLKPVATILAQSGVAWDPPYLTHVPAMAGKKALKKAGLKIGDIHRIEINEAFASVAIVSSRMMEADPEIVNVNGGAVALGHPIGASGARLLTTLIYELRRRGGGLGLAAICSGTAQGDAMILKVE